MKWLKQLLGIKPPEEKLREQLAKLQQQAFEAQRNGDMELAGQLNLKADQIIEQLYNKDIGAEQ